jgi:DNA-binding beta-propeller fold protein YncE
VQVLRPYLLAITFAAILVGCSGGDLDSTAISSTPNVAILGTAPTAAPISEITAIASSELAAWGTDTRNLAFASPNGLAIDADGFIYTTEFQGNRVRKFNPNGDLLLEWGTSGSADLMFQSPTGIFIGPAGNVYVAESGNDRVQKFTANGD